MGLGSVCVSRDGLYTDPYCVDLVVEEFEKIIGGKTKCAFPFFSVTVSTKNFELCWSSLTRSERWTNLTLATSRHYSSKLFFLDRLLAGVEW